MIHTDARFEQAVEQAVEALERRTDAEVVVVAAERSGTYRDVSFAAASALTLVGLVVLIAVPWPISPITLPLELALTWLLSAWLFSGKWFLRRVVPKPRQQAQVLQAAEAEFHREAVHGTPERTGVLLYLSALEGRVELLPDLGIEGRVPPGAFGEVRRELAHDDLDHFLSGLGRLGDVLERHVPPREGAEVVDLPNAPRIRP